MKLIFLKGKKFKEILEFKVTLILRRFRETGPRSQPCEDEMHRLYI